MSVTDDEINDEIFFEFTIGPCDVRSFSTLFFSQRWTEEFLQKELDDIEISVGNWESTSEGRVSSSSQLLSSQQLHSSQLVNEYSLRRTVRSLHPSTVSFPGLASHAENIKEQCIRLHRSGRQITMQECTTLNGIPMSDYFVINMVWVIEEMDTTDSDNSTNRGVGQQLHTDGHKCRVRIYVNIDFKKSTWFQGTIISNTKAELLTVCEKWKDCVTKGVAGLPIVREGELSPVYKERKMTNDANEGGVRYNASSDNLLLADPVVLLWNREPTGDDGGLSINVPLQGEPLRPPLSRTGSSNSLQNINMANSPIPLGSLVDEDVDDDAIFYDCCSDAPLDDMGRDVESLQPFLPHRLVKDLDIHASDMSYRGIVISFVDITFVLLEFLYWQLHSFYQNDMRYLFDVKNTFEIFQRAVGSLVPGNHDKLLTHPDLYGPVLCVLCLPQVFLIAIDTSRHGCTRSGLLGNGVVVCLCMWIGLSCIFRIVSFIIAPKLKLSQFASTLGYSFFAWGISLALSITFDVLSDSAFGLPPALPLVLIGLPAAAKHGLIFWEYTAPSPLKLDAASFPVSLRPFVDRHHAVLQYLVWSIPKLLALFIIAGTHYQCLWYLARVFLPGKQQQCRLSRLIQPSAYADILAQKELIRYAGELIKTGHVPPA